MADHDPPTLRQRPVHSTPRTPMSNGRLVILLSFGLIALIMILNTILTLAK